jgi:hypothetical protein
VGEGGSMKVLKKILFITDDWNEFNFKCKRKLCEKGNYFYNKESNWLRFKFFLRKDFVELQKREYDAVLIDYGLIDNKYRLINSKPVISFLQDYYMEGIKLAWVGGLGGLDKYNMSAQIDFPQNSFLHKLPTSSTGHEDILYLLYRIFEDEKPKEQWGKVEA